MKNSDNHGRSVTRKSNNKVPHPLAKNEPNPIYKPTRKDGRGDLIENDD